MLLFYSIIFCHGRNCMNVHTKGLDFLFQLDCFFMNILFKLDFFLLLHERCINDGNMICLKLPTLWPLSKIVYMCSSLLHLAVESCDLSQAVVTSWENSPTSFHPKISPMNNLSKKQLSMSMCFWSVTLADQLSSQFLIFFWSAIRKLSGLRDRTIFLSSLFWKLATL